MRVSGRNTGKKSAVIAAIRELDRIKPGFMEAVKQQVRIAVGTPQKGLSGMFLGDVWDDIAALDYDDTVILDKYLPPDITAVEEDNWWESIATTFAETAKAAIPAYFAYEKEKDWADLQLTRARQGLPPLRTEGYGAPATKIDVTTRIPQGTISREVRGIFDTSTDTKQLLIGGAVIAGLFFLSK